LPWQIKREEEEAAALVKDKMGLAKISSLLVN
jgi:hypothetical protein